MSDLFGDPLDQQTIDPVEVPKLTIDPDSVALLSQAAG